MLIDFLIYWFLIWVLVTALNASVFKRQPASRTTAWSLTIAMFFVNLLALTVLRTIQYKVMSQDLGIEITPTSPARFGGAFAASWFFFVLLRKAPRQPKPAPSIASASTASAVPATEVPAGRPSLATAIAQPPHYSATADVAKEPVKIMSNHPQTIAMDDDDIYAVVAEELETGNTDKGLWTRIFAECDGDEGRTKVAYIKRRAAKLIEAEHVRVESIRRQQEVDSARLIADRQERMSVLERWAGNCVTDDERSRIQALSTSARGTDFLNAVRWNQMDKVQQELEAEPLLIAVSNSHGLTPLHVAADEQSFAMTDFLLRHGAPPNIKDSYHHSPLDLAKTPQLKSLLMIAAQNDSITLNVANAGPDTIAKYLTEGGYTMTGQSGQWTVREPTGALIHLNSIGGLRQYAQAVLMVRPN